MILEPGIRYPGLAYTAKLVGKYFPTSKIHVEPFSGLGRTVQYVRADKIILNDMSDYANKFCKKTFPNAIITHQDFVECILRWDGPDTFFLIDPPWDNAYYTDERTEASKEKLEALKGVKLKKGSSAHATKQAAEWFKQKSPAFIDRPVEKYMHDLEKVLDNVQAHYLITISTVNKLYAPFTKNIKINTKNPFVPKTLKLCSNKPIKIRIPQITNYF